MSGPPGIDATHDPARRSWVASANRPNSDFPIQNLPFGCFRRPGETARGGVAIGDKVVDIRQLATSGLLTGQAAEAAQAGAGDDLHPLLALGNHHAEAFRHRLSDLLTEGSGAATTMVESGCLIDAAEAEMLLPLPVRQFTDMCVSTYHIGRRRGNDANGEPICPPMFRTIPVGYDGRASSVVVSGTPVRRPNGTWQVVAEGPETAFGPEPRQDYELELGLWIGGKGNVLGTPLTMGAAADVIWGYSLVNDWSARGIQFWETMLGPFLGKSLSTTVSPWIVTTAALAPFRTGAFKRPTTDPSVPPHLASDTDQAWGGLGIQLQASIQSAAMTKAGSNPHPICRTDFRHMYWTPAQMVAHHASNGCSLGTGDLIGSGTCSGPEMEAAACLSERALAGSWTLPTGEERLWLEDGDTVILTGTAHCDGFVPIGFGEARGTILPALSWPSQESQHD